MFDPNDHRDRRRSGRPRRLRAATAAVVVALLVGACGSPSLSASPAASPVPATPEPTATASATAAATPSAAPSAAPSASGDPSAAFDAVERQVVAIRGLQPIRPVERRFIDATELRALLTADFDKETPPDYVAANERLYKALGLIPADASLRNLSLDLLSGGVVGFYRNDEGRLYVLSSSGAPGANERFTFAHEYDHALQDQHFTVFTDQKGILDQSDRMLARQAVYEGDATLLMTQWAAANLDQAGLLELIAASSDPAAQALMNGMPAILRETLVYPYTTGLAFVQRFQADGGWPAVDALYARMPVSTEQVLHPEKYAAGEAPVKVTMPDDLATRLGSGWKVPLEDTFGEFQLGIWLREGGVPAAQATDAAAGWGGDRLAVVQGPDGAWGVVMRTTWDTEKDAAEFLAAAQTAVDGLPGPARISAPAGKNVTIMIASDDATLLALDMIFGATGV